LVVR